MESSELQRLLIEHIRKRIPAEKNLAAELSDILSISKSAAYKRINGKTTLSFDDLAKLVQRFNLPLDKIANP